MWLHGLELGSLLSLPVLSRNGCIPVLLLFPCVGRSAPCDSPAVTKRCSESIQSRSAVSVA